VTALTHLIRTVVIEDNDIRGRGGGSCMSGTEHTRPTNIQKVVRLVKYSRLGIRFYKILFFLKWSPPLFIE
jgi:hypothetical protein